MNFFTLLPATVRLYVFIAVGTAALAVSATGAGYAAIKSDSPPWLTFTGAVITTIAAATNYVAASHVSAQIKTGQTADKPKEG